MRKDFEALPWLTAEQAVTTLREMTKTDITYKDLISHCQYFNCEAFIVVIGLRGCASAPLAIGEDDWTYTCIAHGPQRVINAEVLAGSTGAAKLYLQGTVRTGDDEDAPKFDDVEWEAEADPTEYAIQFRTASIQNLADLINGPTKALDPRERRSLHKIIAVLLAECGIDPSNPFAAHAVLAAAAARHGIEFGLNDDTVAKHLKAATS